MADMSLYSYCKIHATACHPEGSPSGLTEGSPIKSFKSSTDLAD